MGVDVPLKPRIVALVTARGGSQAMPRKNVALVGGKPMIAWTIEAALRSRLLSRVIVSTDDDEIADVSRKCGAEVPFMRPAELARADTPHMPVVIHVIEWLDVNDPAEADYILLLQPTSPLRTTGDIDAAIELAVTREADSVVSVCPAHSHPYLAKHVAPDGTLSPFIPGTSPGERRQDLPPAYVLNGAIFLTRRSVVVEQRTFHPARTLAYVMPIERSLDVDDAWEVQVADALLAHQRRKPDAR